MSINNNTRSVLESYLDSVLFIAEMQIDKYYKTDTVELNYYDLAQLVIEHIEESIKRNHGSEYLSEVDFLRVEEEILNILRVNEALPRLVTI